MPHAIIRGANGRRHEVDFGDAPVRVEIHASEETVEIFIEADSESLQALLRRRRKAPERTCVRNRERWRLASISGSGPYSASTRHSLACMTQ
jgi:hypothetical protein